MKKIIALLLVAVMCFSLTACGGDKETSKNSEIQQETEVVDISKLEGTWRGTEDGANWEMYFVFDGNGNMSWYSKNIDNDDSLSMDGTFKYEYYENTQEGMYWSVDEEGAFCPVEITEENGNVQYKILNMICEEVENFTPSITE